MKIEINNKQYGLQWGMGAIRIFCDRMGCEFETGLEMILGAGQYTVLERSKAVSTMILAAIENYCNLNATDFDVTFPQVENYRDITPQDKFRLIMEDFTNSMVLGQTLASYLGITTEPAEQTAKKKSPSRKK